MVSMTGRGRRGWKIRLQDETDSPRSERESRGQRVEGGGPVCVAAASEPAGVDGSLTSGISARVLCRRADTQRERAPATAGAKA